MMPGNYARMLFNEENSEVVLDFITDENKCDQLRQIFNKFRFLRSVYRAIKPDQDSVNIYKRVAVEMGELLKIHFDFAQWPNYLHKIIEHVQEILEDPNGLESIGAFTSEGNEAGNKLFRLLRKNYANKGNSYMGLEDVLKLHWLYSSNKLQKLAEVRHRLNKCSKCLEFGHNRRSCKQK